jgi:hypothetical protein
MHVVKCSATLAFVAALLVGAGSARAAEKSSHPKQLRYKLRICEGDPLGNPKFGTVKTQNAPEFVATEGRPFTVMSGGQVPVPNGSNSFEFLQLGWTIKGKHGAVKDGKVRVDITLRNRTMFERTAAGRMQFHSEGTRVIMTVPLGEVVKLRLGKGTADKQKWVELTVDDVRRIRPVTPKRADVIEDKSVGKTEH